MNPTDDAKNATVRLSWTPVLDAAVKETAILKQRGDAWEEVGRTAGSEFVVKNVLPGETTRFAAAPVYYDGSLAADGDWTLIDVVPVLEKKAELPATPAGFVAAQDGAVVTFRWDAAEDGVTATHEIRAGASWEDGTVVERGIEGNLHPWSWWSSGTMDYWIRAVDAGGRYSKEAATLTLTIDALDDHVDGNEWDDAGDGFLGTKTDLEVSGGALRPKLVPTPFNEAAGVGFNDFEGVPWNARYYRSGTYQTADRDLGQIEHERLEVGFASERPDPGLGFNAYRGFRCVHPKRDSEGLPRPLGTKGFAHAHRLDMVPVEAPDVLVEVDTSPTAGGAWDGFRPFVPGRYTMRRVRFRVTLTGDGIRELQVPDLLFRHRRLNKKDEGTVAVTADPGPTVIAFTTPFCLPPVVTANPTGANDELRTRIVAVTKTGASVRVLAKERWVEVPFVYGDFSIAALSIQVDLYSAPAGWEVTETFTDPTVAFNGPGFAAVSLALGTATGGLEDCLASDFDVFQAVGATVFQRTSPTRLFSKTGATTLKARLTGDQNLNGLTAGAVTVKLKLRPVTSDALQEVFTGNLNWHAKGV